MHPLQIWGLRANVSGQTSVQRLDSNPNTANPLDAAKIRQLNLEFYPVELDRKI